jgi:hypothetical protein
MLRRWHGADSTCRDDIFIINGEAQRHVRLTPPAVFLHQRPFFGALLKTVGGLARGAPL